jgi:hypothetical protein
MNTDLPTLITTDAKSGLDLAAQLAERLQAQLAEANAKAPRPGGMNYLMPPSVPKETIAGMLFYAIAAANHGWHTDTEAAAV